MTEQQQLRAFIERITQEAGENPEIVRQCVADLHEEQRASVRNNFEARQEYNRQMAEQSLAARRAVIEYGLQTLKWSFLLNAGAIAIIVAYVGSGLAKSTGSSPITFYAPLLKALWPFAVGCVLVVFAGVFGFFNLYHWAESMPSAEDLYKFTAPAATQCPTRQSCSKIDTSRRVAIVLAFGSALFFAYGVYRVWRAVLLDRAYRSLR